MSRLNALIYAEWIRETRRRLEISQKKLAKTVGCSHQLIEKIEKKKVLESRFLERILEELKHPNSPNTR